MDVQDVLARLNRPDAAADRLLDECHGRPAEWAAHPHLYEAFTARLIQQGHAGRALDLAREGQAHLQDNVRLQYHLALAAARGGNPHYAEALLAPLLTQALTSEVAEPGLRVDIIALKGRILKDRSRHDPELAAEAAGWYERAAAATDDATAGTFPLINAASMWRVAGCRDKSEALAAEVVSRLSDVAVSDTDVWQCATLGEAHLLLGRHAESVAWYERAVRSAVADNRVGDLASIRANYQRLKDVGLSVDTAFLDRHLGSVVAFSGHMIDSPDRLADGAAVRFPQCDQLVAAAAAAIADCLSRLNATVGFCSLACGGDLLFAEAMLARGAELHVVLPFAEADFYRTSVDFGQDGPAWRAWRRRYEAVRARVPDKYTHYATAEPYLGSDGLYDFANDQLQGLTVMRARERVSDPKAVVLVDRSSPGLAGGTAAFADHWRRAGYAAHEIDLAALRRRCRVPAAGPPEAVAPPPAVGVLRRPIRAMLFADVAGYSGIPEGKLSQFLQAYSTFLRDLFDAPVGRAAEYANTWGDGLYAVFRTVAEAAAFALELVDPMTTTLPNWALFGLGQSNPFRVGLHAGPVFELPNVFHGRTEYAGQHVNRAARIEPVTVRGCAYASEPFAALLTMTGGPGFLSESVGVHALAKGYDRCPLYRVLRA